MDLKDRAELLRQCADNPQLQALQMEMCRRDVKYFISTFCWTTNPRAEFRDLPFNLYPFQEWLVDEIVGCIEDQVDCGVVKSRDMGVTWLVVVVMVWYLIFHPGYPCHVGSKKEQDVCNAQMDPDSTIFGKIRYVLYMLPPWMLPSISDKKLSLLNEDNNNIITGESANPSFGRSRRYRFIFFDELAFWEKAEAAYEGCADTTNCRIAVSTPYGESNKFYNIKY